MTSETLDQTFCHLETTTHPKTDDIKGVEVIAQYLEQLDQKPGVYRMLNEKQQVLYVGKAKNLKKRVTTYTKPHRLPLRLQKMISETRSMAFLITANEGEALLLEANLIKEMKPKYNVLLRDDKEFPQILIKTAHTFPQITKHRGKQKEEGIYFGPFSSIAAVTQAISSITKIFLLRTCSDEKLKTTKRPCLQYQIKRCSAPCVGFISSEKYHKNILSAQRFLKGEEHNIIQDLSAEMEELSQKMEFEKAAVLRDRIKALSKIQSHQIINTPFLQNADVIALATGKNMVCIQVMFIRAGRMCGNAPFFIKITDTLHAASILNQFIMQFYLQRDVPPVLMCQTMPFDHALIAQILKTKIISPQKGPALDIVTRTQENASYALQTYGADQTDQGLVFLAEFLHIPREIKRVEVYDNSHISGKDSCGAMIVVTPQGFEKKAYRKWYIKNASHPQTKNPSHIKTDLPPQSQRLIKNQDDYAMMREVLTRRFQGSLKDEQCPDIILIDGGKGQLNVAHEVLKATHLDHKIMAIGISKGPKRNAGEEILHFIDQDPIQLDKKSPLLYFLQQARDEAHRFVIQTHRKRRSANQLYSRLDDIPGLGPKRKKSLLHHFGSSQAVFQSSVEDLIKIPGISRSLAQNILHHSA